MRRLLKYVHFADPAPYRRIALAWRSSFPAKQAIEVILAALRGSPPAGVGLLSGPAAA